METIWLCCKILFWLILGFSILHALVTHFVLLYEMRLQSLATHSTLSISPWILIKSIATEIVCSFLRICLAPFCKWPDKNGLLDAYPKTPILLVHGYGQTKMDWLWFQYQLKRKNVGPVYTINLCPPFASIVDLAQLLKTTVQKIQQETHQSNIILIGHSMGGLVSSYYAEFLSEPGEVTAVITLGSPFQGTKLAALGYGKNAVEMAPHSPLLKEIAQRMQNSKIRYYYVASKIDNLIVPWQAAIASSNTHCQPLILDDHGHLKLLISPKVLSQVVEWITSA